MRTQLHSLLVGAACALVPASLHAQAGLSLLNSFSANQGAGTSAGEIVAFDAATAQLFVTSSGGGVHQVNVFGISGTVSASAVRTIDFSTTFGDSSAMLGLSSVAVDPLGRFGVASLIPQNNTGTLGRVGFFDLASGAVLGTAEVGYHPDSLVFSSDGSRLVVVNEGETNPAFATNAPGSLSVFNLGGIHSGNLNTLSSLVPTTKDFSAPNLAAGVSIAGLRNHNDPAITTSGTFIGRVPARGSTTAEAIEPEYASIAGDKVYVSLQENNAVAVYDLGTEKWVEVKDLGTISQRVDASDQDGGANVNDTVKGLPMPDTVATYTIGGKTYLVTANEGDARVDDRDASRFGDVAGDDSTTPILDDNYPATATGVRANSEVGRLNISRLDGDTDGDGLIDEITMFGTRSFSIYEQTEGGLVRAFDSGSFFEDYIAANGGFVDSRSDDKGPEPEGLTVVSFDGRTYLFIGMERSGHVFMFDITDPENAVFLDAELVSGAARPESLLYVDAANSPTGFGLLFVGFEGDGNVGTEQIAVFQVTPIPEPASVAALAGFGALGLAVLRRRRRVSA